ncbi:MAG: hypothetical protein ACKV2V_11005 [Blastocatellia bacterium]
MRRSKSAIRHPPSTIDQSPETPRIASQDVLSNQAVSGAPAIPGPLARFLLPSLSGFCLLLTLAMLLANAWRFLQDSDTGWHIRAGDLIRRTGAAPRVDTFSHTMPGHEWLAWEWLTEALMSWLHAHYGLAGLVAMAMLTLCLSYGWLCRMMIARGADAFIATALTLLGAMISLPHWLARPHLLSIPLLLLWLWMVETWRAHRGAGAWRGQLIFALPPLLAIWANLHGAFAVTLPMLTIYALGEILETGWRGNVRETLRAAATRTWFIAGALCWLATLATPYGIRLYGHLWEYLSDRELLARIDEFQSPDFHTVDGRLIEILLLLAALALGRALTQRRFTEAGLLVFWAHLTLQAQRHAMLAVLVMAPIMATHLTALATTMADRVGFRAWRAIRRWYRGILTIDRQLNGAGVLIAATVFLLWLGSGRPAALTEKLLQPQFDNRRLPVKAADFLAAKLSTNELPGNLYAPDQFGGYLLYRFPAQIKVFMDGRSDFYRRGPVFDDYQRISGLAPGWNTLLDRYRVGWMLLRRDSPLSVLAQNSGQWSIIYSDDTAQVLINKSLAPR